MKNCSCTNCGVPDHWPQCTDAQWALLAPLLPQGAGRRGDTTRLQVAGMLFLLESGAPWRLLPTQFGAQDLVETRFRRWAAAGVFRRAYHELYPPGALADGRTVVIDGTYAKAHRSAAGARVDRSGELCEFWCPEECPPKRPWYCRETQAIGKTRGGFNTNIVAVVNEDRRLVNWTLLAGTAPEPKAMPRLLEGISPAVVVADKLYDIDEVRWMLENRGIEGAIPNHARRTRHPYPWHPAIRKQHLADNFFADLKSFRRVATRYEKTTEAFDAMIALAALWIQLRKDCPG